MWFFQFTVFGLLPLNFAHIKPANRNSICSLEGEQRSPDAEEGSEGSAVASASPALGLRQAERFWPLRCCWVGLGWVLPERDCRG